MPLSMAPQQQWPRGPANDLHVAAFRGSVEGTIALLSRGSIIIDQGDPTGRTPLMLAAHEGFSRVVRVLLNRGAHVSIAMDGGVSALHLSAQDGHLAVTIELLKAGADLEARTSEGATPLHLAAQEEKSEVMVVLIEAGADIDSRSLLGATPLSLAAGKGHIDIVRKLLRARANPLLNTSKPTGIVYLPLDEAAYSGASEVVRELILRVGIKGCAGASGGVVALTAAAEMGHVDVMVILTDAGVVDTGLALGSAAGWGGGAAVKFLLQQRQLEGSPTGLAGYVNFRDRFGLTALIRSIGFCARSEAGGEAVLHLISPRIVRLLVDAGADTTSPVRGTNSEGVEQIKTTPLAFTNKLLREKKIREFEATEDHLHRLEAVRRLLLRVDAARALSWLWHSSDVPSIAQAAGDTSRTTRTTPAGTTQLTLMLPILRRRRRGALLAPLLRYSSYP